MSRTVMIRALVLVCTGFPVALSAQATSTMIASTHGAADRLEAVVAAPKYEAKDWIEAARALERAAALRAPGDPRAVTDLLGAATAYEIAGELAPARQNAVEGARRATELGHVYTAANAYVAAARLSLQLQDEKGANTCLEQARRLAKSPRLTVEQALVIRTLVGMN